MNAVEHILGSRLNIVYWFVDWMLHCISCGQCH